MKLTLALLKKRNVVPGFKWTGKHQLPVVVHPWNLAGYRKRVEQEDRNLFYIRHPYLTLEQESGFAQSLGKYKIWLEQKKLEKACRRVKPSIRMEDVLGHLNVTNKWEL